MLKATLRSAVLLGLSVALATPAFAEVQNVKVGGDVTVRGFWRENMDLTENSGALDKTDDFFMQTTALNVGADLTENVSAFLRLANERDWNVDGASTGDIDISQAYVTLKELFYSPLTVRIGTQPIVWGRGMIIGSNLIPSIPAITGDRNGSITANEYTDFTAFDAIRATLDLSNVGGMSLPLTADYVYIKLDENGTTASDDVNLQGINLSSRFDTSEVEGYYVHKYDKSLVTPADNVGSLNTWGLRGSIKPMDGTYVYGEVAYQHGKRATDPTGGTLAGSRVAAWLFNLGADYTLADVAMTPKLGVEWIYWGGDDLDGPVGGWDPIARGYFTTAIREFQTAAAGFYSTTQAGDTAAATNQHQLGFYGDIKPMEDLTIAPRYSFFWQDEASIQAAGGQNERNRYAGSEIDTQVKYDYTEDVQLGLLYAVFFPGQIYTEGTDSTAQQLVTTVSVKF